MKIGGNKVNGDPVPAGGDPGLKGECMSGPRVECAPVDSWEPAAGQIFFNVVDGHFWGYNGREWRRLD